MSDPGEGQAGPGAERIVAAAIKVGPVVHTGPHHATIIHQIVACGGETPVKGVQGFMTSSGRMVSRSIARKIAFKAGQVATDDVSLFSEELWIVPESESAALRASEAALAEVTSKLQERDRHVVEVLDKLDAARAEATKAERETESLRYTSDKQTVAWKERALKAEDALAKILAGARSQTALSGMSWMEVEETCLAAIRAPRQPEPPVTRTPLTGGGDDAQANDGESATAAPQDRGYEAGTLSGRVDGSPGVRPRATSEVRHDRPDECVSASVPSVCAPDVAPSSPPPPSEEPRSRWCWNGTMGCEIEAWHAACRIPFRGPVPSPEPAREEPR